MTRVRDLGRWLRSAPGVRPGAARLFCLAHAGGSALAYRPWIQASTPDLEIVAVQLPGHGDRLAEPRHTDIAALTGPLRTALLPYLDRPYAIYGHSMGGALASALAASLTGVPYVRAPSSLVIGACAAPGAVADRQRPDGSDAELVDWIRRVGGTPEDVLASPDLLALLLPVLRDDLALLRSWRRAHTTRPLAVPIRAFAGDSDRIAPPASMHGWQDETAAAFSLTVVPGGHFFPPQAVDQVLDLVLADLASGPSWPGSAPPLPALRWP